MRAPASDGVGPFGVPLDFWGRELPTALHGILLTVCASAAIGMNASQEPTRDTSATNRRPLIRVAGEADLAPQTQAERELAKLYDRGGLQLGPSPAPLTPLEAVLAKDQGNRVYDGLAPPQYASEAAAREGAICSPDAVVIGAPVSYRSFLNDSKTAMVTAYQIAVERWIRPASGKSEIVVGELGGKVLVGDDLYETPPTEASIFLSGASLFFLQSTWGDGSASHWVLRKAPIVSDRLEVLGLEGPLGTVEARLLAIAEGCRSQPR